MLKATSLKQKKMFPSADVVIRKKNHSVMDHIVKQGSRVNNSLWTDCSTSGFTSSQTDYSSRYDVAIIGGGFSGLWSAFHLKRLDPTLSIAIFEAEEIGFGASGRNGGWVSSDYPVYQSTLIKRHGRSKTELLFASLRESKIGRAHV